MSLSFGSELQEARKMKKLTQMELAKLVGVGRRAIISYELDKTRPRRAVRERLEQVLHISLDELSQIPPSGNNRKIITECPEEKEELFMSLSLGSRLQEARKMKKLTQMELAKLVGVSRRVIISYELNKTRPRGAVRERLEQVLHMSLDESSQNPPSGINYEIIIEYARRDECLARSFATLFEWVEKLTNKKLSLIDCEGIDSLREVIEVYDRRRQITEKIEELQRELEMVGKEIFAMSSESG